MGVALTSGLAPNFNSGVLEKRPIQKSYGTIYIQQSKPEGKQAEELARNRKGNLLPVRRGCRVIFVLQLNKGGRRTEQNKSACQGLAVSATEDASARVGCWAGESPFGAKEAHWGLRGLLLLRLRLHVLGKVLSNQA